MIKTAFACFSDGGQRDALIYQELPRKTSGEEFFLFMSPGNPAQERFLRTLYRHAISASRLGHPVHYFIGLVKNFAK